MFLAMLCMAAFTLTSCLNSDDDQDEITSSLMTEAEELFKICEPGVIDKTRYLVKSGNHTFEVDEFYGDNEGLVMAEVELQSEDEPFEKPDFIGKEVTGDRRFYNGHLRQYPFIVWGKTLSAEYR